MTARNLVSDFLTPEIEFDDPGDADAVRPVRLMKKEAADPALLAARHILRAALSDPALRAAASAPGKAVIVLVPDVGQKAFGVDRAIEHAWRIDPVAA